eukprot:5087475-Pleurochrysis_carterae.AAC.1
MEGHAAAGVQAAAGAAKADTLQKQTRAQYNRQHRFRVKMREEAEKEARMAVLRALQPAASTMPANQQ